MSLILSRKAGESIVLTGFGKEPIVIAVHEIRGTRTRIRLELPAYVNAVRDDAINLEPPTSKIKSAPLAPFRLAGKAKLPQHDKSHVRTERMLP